MALDKQIDELYQLPLGEFTAARNALTKSLSGADASRVKRLEKPTVVPWAINQLYWRDRPVYDRLMKSGAALRTAQIHALEGKKADVRKAGEAHRKALAEAVERATELAAEHGAKPGPEPLSRMLEALSISATPPAHPGRMTDVVQPAGFEALTGVTPRAVPTPARDSRAEPSSKAGGAKRQEATIDREALRRAEAERREKEAKIAAAERTLERARAAESQARRALKEAEEEVRTAQAALDRLKS